MSAQRIELYATKSQHFVEQPISPQTSPRKTRKRPYSLVLFILVGAGAAPACTRKKNK